MAPKQQQPKQQANHKASQPVQPAAATAVVAEAEAPFLKKEVRLELADGRVVVGTVVSFLGSGDMVLMEVTEFRSFTADENHGVAETCIRQMSLMAVPFHCIVALHERKPGHATIMETVSQKVRQQYLNAASASTSE